MVELAAVRREPGQFGSLELSHRFCVAPMLDWTDRHFRYFARRFTRRALLYTEMVPAEAITRGDTAKALAFDAAELPLALQVGGSKPTVLGRCAQLAEAFGYSEINLNVGCPSSRVQTGAFGACLMAQPELVAECVAAMVNAAKLPVTVKTRIGIDALDSYEHLHQFVATVRKGGARTFIVHARKAWLHGLSPKENREIPPLRYDVVKRLKTDFPDLEIVLNGGIESPLVGLSHLAWADGVMLGRSVYHDPYSLVEVDLRYFGDRCDIPSRKAALLQMLPYVERELARGVRLQNIARHILGLFHGVAGGRAYRRFLSERARRMDADIRVLLDALDLVPDREPSTVRSIEPESSARPHATQENC